MSPLKIALLLDMHCSPQPLVNYPDERHANSPAVIEAFDYFINLGVFTPGVTHNAFMLGAMPLDRLTLKGVEMVRRLTAIEPESGGSFYTQSGMLCNADGSRSIFDDVDDDGEPDPPEVELANAVNNAIYAVGAPRGSEAYFKIRDVCCVVLRAHRTGN